jgi:hypothetical protein
MSLHRPWCRPSASTRAPPSAPAPPGKRSWSAWYNLAHAVLEAPIVEVFEHQQTQHHFGRGARPASSATLPPAPTQSVLHRIDHGLILEHFMDTPQLGVPPLIRVGQDHFEDAALRVLATNPGSSLDREPPSVPTSAAGSLPPIAAAPAAVAARPPPPRASPRPSAEARSSRWWFRPALGN